MWFTWYAFGIFSSCQVSLAHSSLANMWDESHQTWTLIKRPPVSYVMILERMRSLSQLVRMMRVSLVRKMS